MYGPVIAGTTFRLRPLRREDAPLILPWFEDMEITARLGGLPFPFSLEAEEDWIRNAASDPRSVVWAIETEGRLVGTTSICDIDWHNLHGRTGTLIGDRSAWGRGIAGELMRRRADFAFTQLPLFKLKSGYVEGNEASRRAQMRAGYREVGRLRGEVYRDGRRLDLILTELLREDWERARAAG